MADAGEAENELAEPGLGDGEPEEQVGRVGRGWGKSLVEGLVGRVELLVDELAADLVPVRQVGDRLTGEGIQGELLANRRRQQTGRSGRASNGGLG